MARRGEIELMLTATRDVHRKLARGTRPHHAAQLAALLDDPATLCFVCGPASMVDDVPRMLRRAWGSTGRGSASRNGEASADAAVYRFDLQCRLDVGDAADLPRQRDRLGSSSLLFTRPDRVTTPLNVSTSMRRAPTTGSLTNAVFTRVVIVASSMVSPTVLPQAPSSGSATDEREQQRGEPVSNHLSISLRRPAAESQATCRWRDSRRRPSALRP